MVSGSSREFSVSSTPASKLGGIWSWRDSFTIARATRLAISGSAVRRRICASGRGQYPATTCPSSVLCLVERMATGTTTARLAGRIDDCKGGYPSSTEGVRSTAPAKPAAARKVRKPGLGVVCMMTAGYARTGHMRGGEPLQTHWIRSYGQQELDDDSSRAG